MLLARPSQLEVAKFFLSEPDPELNCHNRATCFRCGASPSIRSDPTRSDCLSSARRLGREERKEGRNKWRLELQQVLLASDSISSPNKSSAGRASNKWPLIRGDD